MRLFYFRGSYSEMSKKSKRTDWQNVSLMKSIEITRAKEELG
jgi:hypothetical protein